MPVDLGVLDTAIAMVVVILVLSMIVQSVQTFLKKLFKIKSRQIEKSLQKLFDHVQASAPPANAADAAQVLQKFGDLGRETMFGRRIIESISKADLSRVVASIEGTSILPEGTKTSMTSFFTSLQQAQTAVNALAGLGLSPDGTAKLTELRTKLAPLVAHIGQLFSGGSLNANLVIKDVMTLRDFDTKDVLKTAVELQTQLDQALAANPGNAPLQTAATAAQSLAKEIGDVHARLATIVSGLRERLDTIESWYDTVMQGFEERYARHMRSFAFLISLGVAIILNADVVLLYKRLATDDVSQQRILAQQEAIQKNVLAKVQAAQASISPTKDQDVQALWADYNNQITQLTSTYPALGLEPINIRTWYDTTDPWQKANSLFGWLVMALLLSLGAPFWQDTLESLFAFKNLLRQKGAIKNVEKGPGEGNPKP